MSSETVVSFESGAKSLKLAQSMEPTAKLNV